VSLPDKSKRGHAMCIILLTEYEVSWRFKLTVLLLRLVAWGLGARYYYQREDS